MNKSILSNSEVCQKCGYCCLNFVCVGPKSNLLRMKWAFGNKAHLDCLGIKSFGTELWQLSMPKKCEKLTKKDGKYYCTLWDHERPDYCEIYPDSLFFCGEDTWEQMLNWGKRTCPLLWGLELKDIYAKFSRQKYISKK